MHGLTTADKKSRLADIAAGSKTQTFPQKYDTAEVDADKHNATMFGEMSLAHLKMRAKRNLQLNHPPMLQKLKKKKGRRPDAEIAQNQAHRFT